jgi:replicative DNA helicase
MDGSTDRTQTNGNGSGSGFSEAKPGGGGRRGGQKGGPRRPFAVEAAELQRLFDRVPPHSLEAEMSLLGSLILSPDITTEVLPLVSSPSAFYREAHGAIFEALVHLYDKRNTGDLVQLTELLKDRGVLDDIGGTEYLLELAECVPSAANAPHYARIVREKSQLRELIEAAGGIVWDSFNAGEYGDDGAREVLDRAEQSIFKVTEEAAGSEAADLRAMLGHALDMIEQNDGRLVTGVATCYRELDEMTAGLQPGEMCIIAARPSMGKTALALNLTEQIARAGRVYEAKGGDARLGVGFFSLEMSAQSVTQRLLSSAAGVDAQKIRTNQLGREEYNQLQLTCGELSELPIYIDDTPGLSIMALRAKARRMFRTQRIGCIVIDYLQLMSAPAAQREGRQQEVSLISRQVKALARELNIPVICLAQLNRGAEQREGHRPRMSDLRESGSIEQDADVIILLHREEYYHRNNPAWAETNSDKVGVAELIIAKQRNGPTGVVELRWESKITRFMEKDAAPRGRPSYAAGGNGAASGGGGSSFGGRSKTGPAADHRDGGGDRVEIEDPGETPF